MAQVQVKVTRKASHVLVAVIGRPAMDRAFFGGRDAEAQAQAYAVLVCFGGEG